MEKMRIVERLVRIALSVGLLGALVAALMYATVTFGKYYRYGSFSDGQRTLIVVAGDAWGENFGSVAIVDGRKNINIVFDPTEWDQFICVWKNARKLQDQNLRTVGDLIETDTYNTSRLFVLGGPGVRLVLRQADSCVFYDLSRSSYAQFEHAILRVKDHLAGKITAAGQSIDPGRRVSVAIDTFTDWSSTPVGLSSCK